MKVTFLGTGTSHGIPVIGCTCSVCTSTNPKNKRSRCSVWVEDENTSIVIDTAPDFRQQALRQGIGTLDAILFTHAHADHVHGLDDIRPFSWTQTVPVYGNRATIEEIQVRFQYIFIETQKGGGKPKILLNEIKTSFQIGTLAVIPVPIFHGKLNILGFRIGSFAYITDCSGIPEESYPLLTDLDVLVIGALRYKAHETHFSVSQALAEIEKIKPRRAYFTHLCHRIEHASLSSELPGHIRPAWDGLTLFPKKDGRVIPPW